MTLSGVQAAAQKEQLRSLSIWAPSLLGRLTLFIGPHPSGERLRCRPCSEVDYMLFSA